MQTREKRLALILGGVLGLWVVWSFVGSWIMGPLDERRNRLVSLESEFDKLDSKRDQIFAAMEQLSGWRRQSLPPDVGNDDRPTALTAQRLYHDWLTDLATQSGLEDVRVTPGPIRPSRDVYLSVQVILEANARFPEFTSFMAKFEGTELLHHVQELRVDGQAEMGNPLLKIRLVAEGVVIQDALTRSQLFPEAQLSEPLTAESETIVVDEAVGFPESSGFRIRVGDELMTVQKTSGPRWTVRRGAFGSQAAAHPANTVVDLGLRNPLSERYKADPVFEPREMANLFSKPLPDREYRPRLIGPSSLMVTRGEPVKFTVETRDFDPTPGPLRVTIDGETPAGLEFNDKTGEVIWETNEETPAKTYPIQFVAKYSATENPIVELPVEIILKEKNSAPEVQPVAKQTVFHGRTLLVSPQAKDDGGRDQLTWSLQEGAPAGVEVDPMTGTVVWTPDASIPATEYNIGLRVSDGGDPSLSTDVVVPVSVEGDSAGNTRFIGAVGDSKGAEAWFYDQWNNKEFIVEVNEEFTASELTVTVKEIGEGWLDLDVNGTLHRLKLGQFLREMIALESSPESTPADGPARAEDPPENAE
ncbi:putative Ig domain-containing protein [Thalassoroseus pseudoceratinae]|uniref:putative Ig domain-containing protein n=1 Tax=Thalassoroseus pseudoceratinae TaxID=2713176 RepID=UPI0014242AB1|nr:putative Ig domain-containing protein [Thalassoroseus pseudoceratinae]